MRTGETLGDHFGEAQENGQRNDLRRPRCQSSGAKFSKWRRGGAWHTGSAGPGSRVTAHGSRPLAARPGPRAAGVGAAAADVRGGRRRQPAPVAEGRAAWLQPLREAAVGRDGRRRASLWHPGHRSRYRSHPFAILMSFLSNLDFFDQF